MGYQTNLPENCRTGYDRDYDDELTAIPRPTIQEIRLPLVAAFVGTGFPLLRNVLLKRPVYAGNYELVPCLR